MESNNLYDAEEEREDRNITLLFSHTYYLFPQTYIDYSYLTYKQGNTVKK